MFSCNSPQICVTGGSSRKHSTHLCLNMGFQYSQWAPLIQLWMAHLAGVSEIPQFGSCPVCECADPLRASWSTVPFSEILLGSSVICLRCYLFSCSSPQICVTGDSSRKHCTHLCLNMGFQYSRWAPLIQA